MWQPQHRMEWCPMGNIQLEMLKSHKTASKRCSKELEFPIYGGPQE
jgi:hypothetical protein